VVSIFDLRRFEATGVETCLRSVDDSLKYWFRNFTVGYIRESWL